MAVYFLTPRTWARNVVTVVFSLLFYAWGEPRFVLVLVVSIVGNAIAAIIVERLAGASRRFALATAVLGNLGLLGVYKYSDFVVTNVDFLLEPLGMHIAPPHLPLPLGISFFTFHALSYLIDVYRGRFAANRNPIEIALYMALFPQLIAGPIVRYKTIAHQLHARRYSLGIASAGCRIFVMGLAQKVLVADQLAGVVRAAFDSSYHPGFAGSWVGLISFTLQIYFDFAGYSNMAVGLGLCLGFALPRNFRLPYTSRSVTDFWRRWHMSLSSWLRDYLYIPLGGNRGSAARTYRNLVIVFLLCGLWHGASWNFVLWGAWHGGFLVLERTGLRSVLARSHRVVARIYTLAAVMGGWVLFRTHDVASAIEFYRNLAGLGGWQELSFDVHAALQPTAMLAMAGGCLLALVPRWPHPEWLYTNAPGSAFILRRETIAAADGAWTFGLLVLSMNVVASGAYSPFLYFRF